MALCTACFVKHPFMVSSEGVLLKYSDMKDTVTAWRFARPFFDTGPNQSALDITGIHLAVPTLSPETYDTIKHIIPGQSDSLFKSVGLWRDPNILKSKGNK
jgi:hypothetical protein